MSGSEVVNLQIKDTINELRSLNRTISCGELRCMDCNSTNISFSTGESVQTSYSFDVSTVEMRNEIIHSISEKISAYSEEIERLSAEIIIEQERLQSLMDDESVWFYIIYTHPTQCMPPKKLQADRVYGMSFSIDVVKISLRHPFMTRRLAGNSCS